MSDAASGGRRRKRGLRALVSLLLVPVLLVFVTVVTILAEIENGLKRLIGGRKWLLALLVAGVLLVGGAAMTLWYRHMSTGGIYAVVTQTLEFPEESTLPLDEYSVPSDLPQSINLPSIGAEGIIQRLALDTDKKLALPVNVHAAGWYTGSAKPGDTGLSLIVGYTQGKYSKGVFYDLGKLKKGDALTVTFGGGKTRNFTVAEVRKVSVRDVNAQMYTRDTFMPRQLNLVSVNSAQDKGTPAYNERTIVIAEGQ